MDLQNSDSLFTTDFSKWTSNPQSLNQFFQTGEKFKMLLLSFEIVNYDTLGNATNCELYFDFGLDQNNPETLLITAFAHSVGSTENKFVVIPFYFILPPKYYFKFRTANITGDNSSVSVNSWYECDLF